MPNSNSPLAHASQYATMGIPVMALAPGTKIPFKEMEGWQHGGVATTDPKQIEKWNSQFPNANFALCAFAKPGGHCFLEFDQGTLTELCKKYNQPVPRTRVHISGNGGKHFVFLQTPESIALGNRSAVRDGKEWFSFRSDRKYLVGPGSIHPNGNPYRVYPGYDIGPQPIPSWLVAAIEELTETPKEKPQGVIEVHDDFDFDRWSEHYGLTYTTVKDDVWHVVQECPGVGRRHDQSTLTAVFYDGNSIGWSCFAAGCPTCGLTIGQLMKWMHGRGIPPYEGVVWEDRNDLTYLNDPKFGVEILGEVSQESVSNTAPPEQGSPSTVQVSVIPDGMDAAWAERAEELNPTPLPVPDNIDAIFNAPQAEGLAFDERALFGKLGEMARQTGLPLGWAYPGMLAMASALKIEDHGGNIRSNMYCALIAPPGMAKTAVAEAIEKTIFLPEGVKTYTTPASDRGLAKMIGNEGNTLMLVEDEFRAVLGKCQVPNSTLAQMLCKLWSKDQAGVADKKGADKCVGKLCILGNIASDDAADFSKCFASSTVTGLYDRFILGYDTTVVKYRPMQVKSVVLTDEMVVRVPAWVWDAKDRWAGDLPTRRRLPEIALRVALISAAVNGDKEITAPCLAAALCFVEWQERLRSVFKPGLAETKEAECYEAVYAALRAQHDYQCRNGEVPKGADLIGHDKNALPEFLHFTNIMTAKNLYRKYGKFVTGVKSTMLQEGIIEQVFEIEFDEQGHAKKGEKTPFYMLRRSQ